MDVQRIISHVYRFDNGMVMMFDQFGEQMPDYQGYYTDVIDAIRRDAPEIRVLENTWDTEFVKQWAKEQSEND